jgi:DNA-binding transcriptional LysR family regulator
MELTYLRYFRAVAEHGSLTAAARALGCSQPTLTAAVRRLEERFGTTLLLRSSRGVEITSTGAEVLRCAVQVHAVLEDTDLRVADLERSPTGRFVVGCHESLGAYFLPAFLRAFHREAPQVEVVLWNGPSAEVVREVLERSVHFGLVVNPDPHPDLVMVPAWRDAMGLFAVTPAEDLGAARSRIQQGPIIAAGRLHQSRAWLDYLEALAITPRRIITCGDLELVKSLTLGELGVGLLPRRVAAYGAGDRLHPLHPALPVFPDEIYLVYRADLHRTRAGMQLKDALLAQGKAIDADYVEPESVPAFLRRGG